MIIALRIADAESLEAFSSHLRERGIPHGIAPADGLIVVDDRAARDAVLRAYYDFRDEQGAGFISLGFLAPHLLGAPVSLVLMFLMILAYPLTGGFDAGTYGAWFRSALFTEAVDVAGYVYRDGLSGLFARGEYWRFLTPAFVHFGWEHLVFNLVGVFVLGTRIEREVGSLWVIVLLVAGAVVSNTVQYIFGAPGYFGGMSGVVYALVGFGAVWSAMVPARALDLPAAFYGFLIFMVVLGFLGVIEDLTGVSIANFAHLGGLLFGAAAGAVAGAAARIPGASG